MESDYQRQEREITNAIHATGPLYAAEFTRLTGTPWHYVDPRDPRDTESGRYQRSYRIVQTDTGLALAIHPYSASGMVECVPSLPLMPNGGTHGSSTGWREWHFRKDGDVLRETPKAGVAYNRFLTDVRGCAKRFHTVVYKAYSELFPQVGAKIKETADGYQEMERVASRLIAEFNGRLPTHNRTDSTRTVYFGNNLPSVTVTYGGHLRVEHPPFTLETFRAYARAVLANKES